MAAIANGIAYDGTFRPSIATFLVFADAEADVAARAARRLEVLVCRDVVERRTVKIRAAADEQRQLGRERLEHVATGGARGELGVGRERRHRLKQRGGGGGAIGRSRVEQFGERRIRRTPRLLQA
ncbi:MAG: hypothetical protein ACKOTF_01655 [Opitutaceae bacterium]